jgi:Tfp pilus assembly protein PilN
MRNIDSSEWLKNPELEVIETKKDNAVGSSFTLFADQVTTISTDSTAPAPNKGPARKNVVARTGGNP